MINLVRAKPMLFGIGAFFTFGGPGRGRYKDGCVRLNIKGNFLIFKLYFSFCKYFYEVNDFDIKLKSYKFF